MLSTTRATTLALRRGVIPSVQCRLMSSSIPPNKKEDDMQQSQTSQKPQRRGLHQSATTKSEATTPVVADIPTTKSSSLVDRFVITAEVTVSKIFPAGFGWQTASVVADQQGFAADSLNFALTTGAGDALGVVGGHCLYYAGKRAVTGNDSINLTQELHTGILLGSAAFCSGTVWQPVVNALQGANLPFSTVMAGTWVACGAAFYAGLRMGRSVLPLSTMERPTYQNSLTDASLSVAIGGATGFFVGTDAAYLPEQNFLVDVVGIADGTPDMVGAAIAGTSTSMGFMTAQSGLNVVYPKGRCWND